jgi:two-component system nitrate/nitrite sensor histidine kinase NarX
MKIKIKFYLYFILAITLPLFGIWLWTYNAWFIIIPILLFVVLYYQVYKDFLAPLDNINRQITKHQEKKTSSFSGVVSAIDNLINENQYLYDDMELVLDKQVQRLSKKTASLEILYGVVEKLNKIDSKKELFKQFLQVFIDMTGAHGGMVRELVDGKMRLAFQINASIADVEIPQTTPCSDADGVQFSTLDCISCVKNQHNIGTVFIPLNHNHKNLGAFALFFQTEPSLAYDERMLMQAIADNIALYLDKLNEQEQAKIAEIAKEKLYLSQEIHDSLAQTIYSINLQISVLQGATKDKELQQKLTILQTNIKQANNELRELIDNFRTPALQAGSTKLQELIEKFKQETGIKTYLQVDTITLPLEKQTQILRIISEALANIKKHAHAKNVRIVYNNKQLLIEDDGIGFDETNQEGHIGLQVMRERAARIGATLLVESESGEESDGTIIILNYEE